MYGVINPAGQRVVFAFLPCYVGYNVGVSLINQFNYQQLADNADSRAYKSF